MGTVSPLGRRKSANEVYSRGIQWIRQWRQAQSGDSTGNPSVPVSPTSQSAVERKAEQKRERRRYGSLLNGDID